VLEVADDTRDQGGTWVLEAGVDGASMRRGDGHPDLRLPVDVLAAVWLGGVRMTQLVGARRAQELRAGAAARLDRLVTTDRAPWMPFEF
jgi:predicted acetyltransferase